MYKLNQDQLLLAHQFTTLLFYFYASMKYCLVFLLLVYGYFTGVILYPVNYYELVFLTMIVLYAPQKVSEVLG